MRRPSHGLGSSLALPLDEVTENVISRSMKTWETQEAFGDVDKPAL